jgi:hypothetical protein
MVLKAFVPLVACVLMALTACDPGSDAPPSPSESPFLAPSAGVEPSPTPPAVPASPPPSRGRPSDKCVNGWVSPEPDVALARQPIGIVRRVAPFEGPVRVVDMRYFVGPESPPSDKGYLREVRRWYVKMFATREPAYQGRFIVESRRFGTGVAAVAPYDTRGFRSPDWVGFQWNAADTEPKGYAGLPGTWRGIPYDFVRGGEGLEIPGLPAEVGGCLEGT